jgi:PAS domain S-box-containing protein
MGYVAVSHLDRVLGPLAGGGVPWIAAGFAAGVLAVVSSRRLASFVAALAAAVVVESAISGAAASSTVISMASAVAGGWAGARVLRRRDGSGTSIAVFRRVSRLVAAALASGIVSALAAAIGTSLVAGPTEARLAAGEWFVHQVVGVIVIMPVVLAVCFRSGTPSTTEILRSSIAGAAAVAITSAVMIAGPADRPGMFLTLPVLMLAAMVIGGRNAAIMQAGVATVVVALTALGFGRFASGGAEIDRTYLLLFVAVSEVGSLTAAAIFQRAKRLTGELDRIMAAAKSAIVVVDDAGIIGYANRVAIQMFQLPVRLVGMVLGDIVGDDAVPLLLGAGGGQEVDVRLPDGETVPLEITAESYHHESGTSTVLVMRDLRERRRAEEQNRRLLEVVEASPDFIGNADANGRIIYLNRGARDMVGAGDEPLEGLPVGSFAPEWARDLIRDVAIPEASRTGRWVGESAYLGPNGEEIPVSQIVLAHRDERGDIGFYSSIARDIRDRIRHEQERAEFVANLTHDFKNPLVAIMGAAEMMGEVIPPGGDLAELLDIVERGAGELRALIEDMVALERMKSGPSLAMSVVDLAEVTQQVVSLHRAAAASARLSVFLSASPAPIEADRREVQRVVENLISNAIKYSLPHGAIEVSVEPVEGGARLVVKDEGIGIPADELAGVFERYQRSTSAREAGVAGTGLGLAISRAIVERHGGSIEAFSEPGEGTRFVVTLPEVPGARASSADVGRGPIPATHSTATGGSALSPSRRYW